MICLSQSLMGVTVPFDLRVVYKFSNEFFNEILFVCRYSFLKEKTWQLFPLDLSLSVNTLGKFSILIANLINARNIKYSSLFSAFKTSSSFPPKKIKIWEFISCGVISPDRKMFQSSMGLPAKWTMDFWPIRAKLCLRHVIINNCEGGSWKAAKQRIM